jgi:hypothetical protein
VLTILYLEDRLHKVVYVDVFVFESKIEQFMLDFVTTVEDALLTIVVFVACERADEEKEICDCITNRDGKRMISSVFQLIKARLLTVYIKGLQIRRRTF